MEIKTTTDSTDISITFNESYATDFFINRDQYEEDLQRRQKEHLDNVYRNQNLNWRPCLHDSCPECLGTGIKRDGTLCIHNISCPCPKCTPY
jgi:hypothetical protein